jgi:hypothetical protein
MPSLQQAIGRLNSRVPDCCPRDSAGLDERNSEGLGGDPEEGLCQGLKCSMGSISCSAPILRAESTRLPNRAADSLARNSNVAFGRCPSGMGMRRQRWFESC